MMRNMMTKAQGKAHVRNSILIMVACTIIYYLYLIAAAVGMDYTGAVLRIFHDFYGFDFFSLLFFVPVVYAAYSLGVVQAILVAFAAMLIVFPESIMTGAYPMAVIRPTAYGIIMSAIGATIALVQKSDEQRKVVIKELECLYNIGRAADESGSIERFLSQTISIIQRDMPSTHSTGVRITVKNKEYLSKGFKKTPDNVVEALTIGGEVAGEIDLYYPLHKLQLGRKWSLGKLIAERISGSMRRIELEQYLKQHSEQLEEMVKARTSDLEQAYEKVRLLSNTVKSSFDGIILADMKGKVTFANEASQRLWGYGQDEIANMKMPQLFTGKDISLLEKQILPRAGAKSWSGELTAVKKEGNQFLTLVTISPVLDENGETEAIVGICRNITEMKEMRDKVIRSERLAAVGELASSVGHELRNPLNVIRNCIYLTNMTLAEKMNKETADTLQLMDRQIDVANKIVSDLLDFTRVRKPALAKVDLNSLVKENMSFADKNKNVGMIADLDISSPLVWIDPEQVGRAFFNLITNAVQSISGKGEVKVSTALEESHARIVFQDTGCGISPENMKKLFEPLFTTKPKGVGLGLAITKRLIEQNGGSIEVASKVGQGTTFTVTLPVYEKEKEGTHDKTTECSHR